MIDYVKCSGSESSLWHCPAKHREQNSPLPCSTVAYVVCAGKRLLLVNQGLYAVCYNLNKDCCNLGMNIFKIYDYIHIHSIFQALLVVFEVSFICDVVFWQLPSFHNTDSVGVRLRNGRGECVGTVEINYEGEWQRVLKEDWTDTNSNTVCSNLGCGKGRSFGLSPIIIEQRESLKAVSCPPNAVKISDCIISNSNISPVRQQAVMLICEGECILKFCHFAPLIFSLSLFSLLTKATFTLQALMLNSDILLKSNFFVWLFKICWNVASLWTEMWIAHMAKWTWRQPLKPVQFKKCMRFLLKGLCEITRRPLKYGLHQTVTQNTN